jgi:glycerol kinase
MGCTLAIDQGGQSSRAIVFGADGRAVCVARRSVSETRPGERRVEQDPEQIVRSIGEALDEVARDPAASRVERAGLATQRSSIVCWDRVSGDALTPVLSWQDTRAEERMIQLQDRRAEIRRLTGLYPSAHYGASKLAWCLEHVPAVQLALTEGRLACGPLASFIVFRLTRERTFAVDPANASRTLLWSIATRDWEPRLLEEFGIPHDVLPTCVPTRARFGTLALGERTVPLEIVQGDQSAALFAWGDPCADTLYANIGTGAFLQRPIEGNAPELERLLSSVVYADAARVQTVVEGTVNGAGAALAWLAERSGVADWEERLPQWLATISNPPLFVGGAAGLGSPFWARVEPRFVEGETADNASQAVAVTESIVFLIVANVEALNERLPPARRIVVSGGLSSVDGLCTRLASLAGVRVERPPVHEATARGLAFQLSGVADAASGGARFDPVPDEALRSRYVRWRAALALSTEESS